MQKLYLSIWNKIYLSIEFSFFPICFPLLYLRYQIKRHNSSNKTLVVTRSERATPTGAPIGVSLLPSVIDLVGRGCVDGDGVEIVTESDFTHSGSGTRSPDPFTFIQAAFIYN